MSEISTASGIKQGLAEKTKAAKIKSSHAVSMTSIAASAQSGLLCPMKLERRTIASLNGLKKRVRKSERAQIERVAQSLSTLKQSAPVLIDQSGEIINGHIVVKALEQLGETEVWCAVIEHLDENERSLLHVAINRIGETGAFDIEALGDLCIDLDALGFDLGVTGFSLPELDIILAPGEGDPTNESEALIALPDQPVSRIGDLWIMGDHRLYCGDATDVSAYQAVLQDELADVIFTDCPWNIPIEGFVSGAGKIKHPDFVQGAGEMSEEEFIGFCSDFHELGANHLSDGGVFFSCIDWRSAHIIVAAGLANELRHINTAVWNKGHGGMGAPYRSAHELVVVFSKGKKLAVNNVELGKHGRDRTNVWTYPGANRPGSSANNALSLHPTAKPVEMVRDALLDVSNRKAIVLDMFMGSGTTILAAETSGRFARGIELDPKYVDVIINRWELATGKKAIHHETGVSLSALAEARSEKANLSIPA
ncbi:MAG: DNA modification methylase [Erythrobacter sp.]